MLRFESKFVLEMWTNCGLSFMCLRTMYPSGAGPSRGNTSRHCHTSSFSCTATLPRRSADTARCKRMSAPRWFLLNTAIAAVQEPRPEVFMRQHAILADPIGVMFLFCARLCYNRWKRLKNKKQGDDKKIVFGFSSRWNLQSCII